MSMEAASLSVEHLSVGYGQSEVIHDLSLSAESGEILAVMGLNGMGKSTLMKSLIGILPVRSGSIRLAGKQLESKRAYQRVADGLAYVPQGRQVFPSLTVEENIQAGLRSDKAAVPEELYGFFPVLKEMRKRRAGNLSGGQQQQLAIARALATEPKVLLLDEPTEGIQPSIIKELAGVLRSIRDRKGITIVVSEQVLSFALAVADRFLVMAKGKLVHESSRQALDEQTLGRLLSI
jgi:urea transport system ATP-binding protein